MKRSTLTRGLAGLAAALLLGTTLAAAPQAASGMADCPPPGMPHAQHHDGGEHASGHALSLEPLLPRLQLNAQQDALWQQAETASIAREVARRRALQQAHATLQANLANPKMPLSTALRDALPAPQGAPFSGVEWAAFFDSLKPQQAAQVRQFLLKRAGDGMMPGMPEGGQARP
ncbi:hypothetical protein [Vogesella sp. LIG4]|uniref:hypothetical protein n=1 Tax=Vogesella sp. LIG4 TaxID=1192162 RepID=UPI00081FC135|nr:hypothetical protein [Vogesella sp. LIG4]SCK19045.1 hypothetical protein PSELUDRAFT_2074 [Vogesella sp. LIG4]